MSGRCRIETSVTYCDYRYLLGPAVPIGTHSDSTNGYGLLSEIKIYYYLCLMRAQPPYQRLFMTIVYWYKFIMVKTWKSQSLLLNNNKFIKMYSFTYWRYILAFPYLGVVIHQVCNISLSYFILKCNSPSYKVK